MEKSAHSGNSVKTIVTLMAKKLGKTVSAVSLRLQYYLKQAADQQISEKLTKETQRMRQTQRWALISSYIFLMVLKTVHMGKAVCRLKRSEKGSSYLLIFPG